MDAVSPDDDEPAPTGDRDETPDPLLGTRLAGKYELLEVLGEGAMGRIYRARQADLDRMIAIKVLHRHLGGEDRVARRFHREARAASRLSHPNSVQILDYGAENGVLYIAMELLEGEDLQTVLDHDPPLSPQRIAAILVPVLRAVDEAHRAGIVHRDLKPDNVILWADRSGREHVKVCDFGIAKILDGEGNSITVDGFVCGTPQYMAPEQARGDIIDHRVDVYAAGVVLYQMLAGKVPFSGETALGIITKHLTDEPVPPSERDVARHVPATLEDIALKAMSKAATDRYQTAGEMADAITAAVAALGDDAARSLSDPGLQRHSAPPRPAREGTGPRRIDPSGRARDGQTTSGESPVDAEAATREMRRVASRRSPMVAVLVVLSGLVLAAIAAVMIGNDETPASVVPPLATRPATPTASPAAVEPDPPTIEEPAPPLSAPALVDEEVVEVRPRAGRPTTIAAPASSAEVAAPPPASEETPAAVPIPTEPVSPGDAAFAEGRRLFLANEVSAAIERFDEAARWMPRNAEVQRQLGRAHMRAGDVERSVAAYRRYLELAPEAPDRTVVESIIARHAG
jgi:eukaryotic-like serine/threonine-protein kinase